MRREGANTGIREGLFPELTDYRDMALGTRHFFRRRLGWPSPPLVIEASLGLHPFYRLIHGRK